MRLRRLWVQGCLWTTLLAACGGGGGGGTGAAPPPPNAEPQAIHVDARAGSDSHSGTESQPLRTIVAGLARLDAGDTLVVHAGDYRAEGILLIEKTGSPSAPVRITGHDGGEVIVLQVAMRDSDWVELSGLTIIGPKTLPATWRDMPQVVVDDPGVAIDRHEDWSTRVDKVNRKYSSYAHFVYAGTGAASWEGDFSSGINVVASSNVTLRQNDVSLHTACIQLRNLSSGVLVEGNRLHHCLDALKGERRAGDAYSFAQSTIRSNHVEQTFRGGIRLTEGAQHNVVEGNRVEYSGHSHIVTYGAGGDNAIRHNAVQYGGYYAETMRWPGPSGISLHTPGRNTVADGNYVAYQYDIALGDGNGIAVDYGTRVDHAPEYPLVVNNVIYRPMGSGVNTVNAGSTTIVHNTIVEAGHGTSAPQNGMGIRIWGAGDNGNVIANNLIYAPRHGAIYFPFANLSGQAYLDHNLMYAPGVPLVGNGATVYADLASLHAAGLCLNSIAADPSFDDPAQGLLRAGSAAIVKGTGAHTAPVDRAQRARDRLAPTIGAYESANPLAHLIFRTGYEDIDDAFLQNWIYYEGGDPSKRFARIVADPANAANSVLHYWLNEAYIPYGDNGALKGRIQASTAGQGRKEILLRTKLYLHEDMAALASEPSTFSWLTIQEFWNDPPASAFPFRVSVNIVKPSVAPGLRFKAHGQTKVPNQEAWDDVWSAVDATFPVPIGQWMTIETYFKEGDRNNGRFRMTVIDASGARYDVIDVTDFTHHPGDPAPGGLDQFNPLKLYAPDRLINPMRAAGKTLQLYWDDFEYWSNVP